MKKARNNQPERAKKSGVALQGQGQEKANSQAKQKVEKFEKSKKSKRAKKEKKRTREKGKSNQKAAF